jgi:phosphatidylglycerophosphate synthase
VLKAKLGTDLDAHIQRIAPFLFRHPIDPNLLSVLGLAVSLVGAAAFAVGELRWGALAVLLGGACDLVDGVIARHHGLSTRFGAFLDSTLDRVVDMALLLGLVLHYAGTGARGLAWLAALAVIGTVMVSYTKARAEAMLGDFEGGWFERAERIVVLLAGALFGLMPLALVIVAVGSVATALQRMGIAYRRLREPTPEGGTPHGG